MCPHILICVLIPYVCSGLRLCWRISTSYPLCAQHCECDGPQFRAFLTLFPLLFFPPHTLCVLRTACGTAHSSGPFSTSVRATRAGAYFTCFTSKKSQILTQTRAGAWFTCFTGTKVQILTLTRAEEPRCMRLLAIITQTLGLTHLRSAPHQGP